MRRWESSELSSNSNVNQTEAYKSFLTLQKNNACIEEPGAYAEPAEKWEYNKGIWEGTWLLFLKRGSFRHLWAKKIYKDMNQVQG